jgi:uncharacterized protein YegP (UPF0339 family)
MSRQPRFEVVRTDAAQPWHARFRAANGRVIFSTENYARRRGAENAIETMQGRFIYTMRDSVGWGPGDSFVTLYGGGQVEVRYVDERGQA